MKRIITAAILVTCLMVVRAAAGAAAPPTESNCFWVTLGEGGATGPWPGSAVTVALAVSYERRDMILTTRLALNADLDDVGGWAVGDIGILYGIGWRGRITQASVAAGLSYLSGDGPGSSKTIRTIGIPLEAQLTWMPVTFAGLWVGAYGNVNRDLPIAGLMLGVKLGKLR